jgi:hypothetical protein
MRKMRKMPQVTSLWELEEEKPRSQDPLGPELQGAEG